VVDGTTYTLRLREGDRRTGAARIEGDELMLLLPRGLGDEERGRAATLLISRALARVWLPDVQAMVAEANARFFGVRVPAVRLRYLRGIWGSCSRRGSISLSTRLLLAPRVVREYVCVHELAHLVVRGHTPAFWRTVEQAIPQWRDHALWLRRNGDRLWF
jgi:predicted metal-dependent hydrolase